MTPEQGRYRGRFAPSPTGPLHFGSMVAAVGSYLDARASGGEWLVRMEDVDTPRVVPGAADDILRTLERFGLAWDGPVLVQSQRTDAYREALDGLRRRGLAYPCNCSRREVGEVRYPGTCRDGVAGGRSERAWRLRVDREWVCFVDRVQGRQAQQVDAVVGDFVLQRADGLFAYQLAVVVDDAAQGVTDVVRGADLLDSTPRQIVLQNRLGAPTPRYAHLPVATNAQGQKLSKQTRAEPVSLEAAGQVMWKVLRFLGQAVPDEMRRAEAGEMLRWGAENWQPARVPSSSRNMEDA